MQPPLELQAHPNFNPVNYYCRTNDNTILLIMTVLIMTLLIMTILKILIWVIWVTLLKTDFTYK
jgi:hypothetical protein